MQVAQRIVAPVLSLMGEHHRCVVVNRINDIRQRQRRDRRQRFDRLEVRGAVDDRVTGRVRADRRGDARALCFPDLTLHAWLVQHLEEQAIGPISRIVPRKLAPEAVDQREGTLRLIAMQAAEALTGMQVEADRISDRDQEGDRRVEFGAIARNRASRR